MTEAISGMLSLSYQKAVTKLWQNWHPAIVKLSASYRVFLICFSLPWSHTDGIWRSHKFHKNSEKIVQYWRVQKIPFLSSLPEIRCPCALLLLTPLTSMLGVEEEANFATNLKPRDLRSCPQDPPADWRWVSESVWSFSSRNKRTVNVADQMKKPRKCW